jgi:hypothetical protein
MANNRSPITERDLAAASIQLSLIKYFPTGIDQQKAITIFLRGLCGNAEGLNWLVRELVNHMTEWPSPAEIRGIYCSRFKPADGVELDSNVPGYTPNELEMKHIAEHQTLKLAANGESKQLIAGIRTRGDVRSDIEFQRKFAVDRPKFALQAEERITQLEAELKELGG